LVLFTIYIINITISPELDAALEKTPGLYKFCHLSYSRPSELIYNGYTIHSCERTQQGDPLGSSLLCGTIYQILLSLMSELTLGYMDDVTLGSSESQVAQDVDIIRRTGKEIGLLLNDKKCEFIGKTAISTSTNSAFRNFVHLCTE
jgi:Reverse transcriptase (RNA-dependent DNA polymerase)